MTTKEFKLIEKSYKTEQHRWSNLQIGQFVYIEFGRFIEMEYYMCAIKSIDVDNRKVEVIEFSQNEKEITISGFLTIEELNNRGIQLQEPTERELAVAKELMQNDEFTYGCDKCDRLTQLDQAKIVEMEYYVKPHGCSGGDYHEHSHFFFVCECTRPIEVLREHVENRYGSPKISKPHPNGRCTHNVR